MRTSPSFASVIAAAFTALALSGCAATSGYGNAPVLGGVSPGSSVQSEVARGR
ncbi:hypothetical protein BH11PSE8_BH11PSE8_32450 [soil metagenome]